MNEYDMDSQVVEEISSQFFSEITSIASLTDDERLSDDAGMQILRDADLICDEHGVLRENRPEVITLGIKSAQLKYLEQGMQEIEQRIEMLYSFGVNG